MRSSSGFRYVDDAVQNGSRSRLSPFGIGYDAVGVYTTGGLYLLDVNN